MLKNTTPSIPLSEACEIAIGASGIYGDACKVIVSALKLLEHDKEVLENQLSDAITDQKRFNLILELTKHEISDLSPEHKAIWQRLKRGGWWTDDLIEMIDKAIYKD